MLLLMERLGMTSLKSASSAVHSREGSTETVDFCVVSVGFVFFFF